MIDRQNIIDKHSHELVRVLNGQSEMTEDSELYQDLYTYYTEDGEIPGDVLMGEGDISVCEWIFRRIDEEVDVLSLL